MRKVFLILLIVLMATLVACKSEPTPVETGDDGFLHVSTFADFVKGLTSAKKLESKTLVLDADIVWDSVKYPGGKDNQTVAEETYKTKTGKTVTLKSIARPTENALSVDVTGLTIDLGGHKITGVPTNAFNLKGDSFTLKNGSILAADGNERYCININYNGSNASTTNGLKEVAIDKTPAAYTDSDPAWSKRIIVSDLTATGMLCGFSTMEIKNCSFPGGTYRGLVMQGSSGIVENITVDAPSASSAGFVAHSYGTVLLKGTCNIKGKFGLYSAMCPNLIIDSSAVVTAAGASTYALYLETQGKITINGGATVTLAPASGKQAFYMRYGSMVDIAAGATLKDSTGTAIAKPIPAALIDNDGSTGSSHSKAASKDSDWAGYNTAPAITDNRT